MKAPLATCRLQFRPEFGFREAAAVLDYLAALGVDAVYASPVFRAVAGSTHGYDVVDMAALNGELGTEEDFRRLVREAAARGLGWIQDIVPNHMAFDGENGMLMDVLEHGSASAYAEAFDIEWDHPYESIRGRLLTPILGSPFGTVLESGELTLRYDERGLHIRYYDHHLPLALSSYLEVLGRRLHVLEEKLSQDSPTLVKYLGVLYTIRTLGEAGGGEELRRQGVFLKRVLWELYRTSVIIRDHLDEVVAEINGSGESERSLLENLLARQWFRLSFWKVATEEINYRRFFTINGLISLRVEREEVFAATHRLIGTLVGEGLVTGLRVDHIDGLADPAGYLGRLRDLAGNVYIAVEKILDRDEELPRQWPVQGTTGYDFLNRLGGLFCEVRNGRTFNRIYYGFTGMKHSFPALAYAKKRLILEKHMGGDVDNLTLLLTRISSSDRHGADMTRQGLRRALTETLASFPVYRTYIVPGEISDNDRRRVREALEGARGRSPGLAHELRFIERLLLEPRDDQPEEVREARARFVSRFQQFTGPLMAKGFEDTLLYVYNRLLSLNEVGGDPDVFGTGVEEFHRFNRHRSRFSPLTMNATASHDTKRGEDARARISVLSEMPKRWESALKRWSRFNRPLKKISQGIEMPDRNDEYMLYQVMIGSWPFAEEEVPSFMERLREFAVKAVREAKVHTAWLKPDTEYEEAFVSFIDSICRPGPGDSFLADFLSFQADVARWGVFNSLSQAIIKLTAPGLPDLYQGTELWDFSLVDPDNRRPVDFGLRARALEDIRRHPPADLPLLLRRLREDCGSGLIKLFLTYRVLQARQSLPALYLEGDYLPLRVTGPAGRHIVAFARRRGEDWSVTAAARFLATLCRGGADPGEAGLWRETKILLPARAPAVWHESLTGLTVRADRTLSAAEIFTEIPAALLTSRPPPTEET